MGNAQIRTATVLGVGLLLGAGVVLVWKTPSANAQADAKPTDLSRYQLVLTAPALGEKTTLVPIPYVIDTHTGRVWTRVRGVSADQRRFEERWLDLGSPTRAR